MDRQYIRDNQVIERYLSGALTADEEQAFEETYLGDAEILDQIEAAERLRDGIKELGNAGDLERSRPRPRPRWQRFFASPQYAAAASLLLVVSLGLSTTWYREIRNLRESSFTETSAITRAVALDAVRGGDGSSIVAPEPDEFTVLLLDTGVVAYDTYRAVLTRRDGDRSEEIFNRADLVPQLGGTILIGVPGRALRPGTYEARLEGRMADWPAGRFDGIATTSLIVTPRN
jgi:hypothetical protein